MGRVALVSISPTEIYVTRAALSYRFAPCTGGRKFSIQFCDDRTDEKRIYDTTTRYDIVPILVTGEQIAQDLLTNEWLDRYGVFVSQQPCQCGHHLSAHGRIHSVTGGIDELPCTVPGCQCKDINVIPTPEELQRGLDTRRQWMERWVQEGDTLYSRKQSIEDVPDFCQRAGRELGVERTWIASFKSPAPLPLRECEGCGTKIMALSDGTSPAKCKECGAILDVEKAERLGLLPKPLQYQQQPVEAGKITRKQ